MHLHGIYFEGVPLDLVGAQDALRGRLHLHLSFFFFFFTGHSLAKEQDLDLTGTASIPSFLPLAKCPQLGSSGEFHSRSWISDHNNNN